MLNGGWSVKDVLAHIAWGDREGIGVMRARALLGSELWDRPQDERNEIVVAESRSRSLTEVLAEYRSSFDEFMAALNEVSEAELNDPSRFSGLPEGIPAGVRGGSSTTPTTMPTTATPSSRPSRTAGWPVTAPITHPGDIAPRRAW